MAINLHINIYIHICSFAFYLTLIPKSLLVRIFSFLIYICYHMVCTKIKSTYTFFCGGFSSFILFDDSNPVHNYVDHNFQ